MSVTINPSSESPALRAARSIAQAACMTADTVHRARVDASAVLWGQKAPKRNADGSFAGAGFEVRRVAAPNDILNEIAEADQVKLMLGDIAARLLLSLRSDNPVAAFVASSPVPDTDLVVFKDVDGSPVDLTPEIVALLTKMGTVKSVEVATVAL